MTAGSAGTDADTGTDPGADAPAPRLLGVVSQQLGVNVVTLVTGLVTGPVLARALDPVGRGELAAIIAPLGLAPFVLAFGLTTFSSREVARSVSPGRVLGTFGVIALLEGLLLIVPGLALARLLADGNDTVQRYLSVGVLILPLTLAGAIATAIVLGRQRWRVVSVQRLVSPLGNLLCFTLLAAIGRLTVGSAAIVVLVLSLLSVLPALRDLRGVVGIRFDRVLARSGASFGARVWLLTLSQLVNLRLDQVVLVPLASARELGFYAVAVTVAGLPGIAATALASAIFPRVAAGDAELAARACRTALLTVAVLGVGGALVTPILLPLVFGEAFRDSVGMALVLFAAGIPLAGAQVLGSAMAGTERVGRSGLGEVLAIVVTVVGLPLLVPEHGGYGAAWVSLASYSVNFCWLLIIARGTFGGTVRSFVLVDGADLRQVASRLRALRR